MNLYRIPFVRQFAAVSIGVFLLVATVGFVTIPGHIGALPGSAQVASINGDWHPT